MRDDPFNKDTFYCVLQVRNFHQSSFSQVIGLLVPPVISTLFASPFFASSFYTRPRFKSPCISSPVQPNLSSNHKPGDGVISALPEGFAICDIVTRDDFLEQYEDILTVPKRFLF